MIFQERRIQASVTGRTVPGVTSGNGDLPWRDLGSVERVAWETLVAMQTKSLTSLCDDNQCAQGDLGSKKMGAGDPLGTGDESKCVHRRKNERREKGKKNTL